VGRVPDRDLALLHRLEQRRLDLGRSAVDLVRQHQVGEDRAAVRDEGRSLRVEDLGAGDVRREHVGRELEALEGAADDAGKRPHGQRLGKARNALQQDVAAAQQRDQQRLHQPLLPDHDLADGALNLTETGRRPIHLGFHVLRFHNLPLEPAGAH